MKLQANDVINSTGDGNDNDIYCIVGKKGYLFPGQPDKTCSRCGAGLKIAWFTPNVLAWQTWVDNNRQTQFWVGTCLREKKSGEILLIFIFWTTSESKAGRPPDCMQLMSEFSCSKTEYSLVKLILKQNYSWSCEREFNWKENRHDNSRKLMECE